MAGCVGGARCGALWREAAGRGSPAVGHGLGRPSHGRTDGSISPAGRRSWQDEADRMMHQYANTALLCLPAARPGSRQLQGPVAFTQNSNRTSPPAMHPQKTAMKTNPMKTMKFGLALLATALFCFSP